MGIPAGANCLCSYIGKGALPRFFSYTGGTKTYKITLLLKETEK